MSATSHRTPDDEQARQSRRMYLRFGAMILTSMVVMYAVMFLGSWEWSHVRFSESRLFMTLTMGGAMVVVMMAWMLGMYRSARANIAIIAVGVLMIAGGVALDRTQATVQDSSFMSGMIPHHSLAITRSERATLNDVRVCELGVEISEAQRREISEMEWLVDDIAENGIASTPDEAAERPVPDFSEPADRTCPSS
jgi:hypothetical protein